MRLVLRRPALMLAALALASCSAAGSSTFTGPAGAGASGTGTATSGTGMGGIGGAGSTGVGIFDGGLGGGQGVGGGTSGCISGTQFVYTLAEDNTLYSFYPPTLAFTAIGVLDCPTSEGPFSMAVDRNGTAWVVFTDGSLWNVDTTNAHCTSTAYVPGQSGFTTFGMGFSSNAVGSVDETLFVSDSSEFSGSTMGLAKIDTTTLALTPIGMYDKLNARAEMTGTGDARLFGAFEGTPYIVAQIDKTDAKILSEAPQNAISYAPDTSNFAFAFWGGDFWLFVGPGTSTDVFHYQVSSGVTTKVKSVSFEIVGAGVSTCAPITPPM
jgi:hypothetical protein